MDFIQIPDATPLDLSDLRIPIRTRRELDGAEMEQIAKTAHRYFQKGKWTDASWFNEKFLRKLHFDLFGSIWEWGGKYRKTRVLPVGVEPYQIPTEMEKLVEDVAFWTLNSSVLPLLEQAARIHHRLTWIHPFPNGNGRFSRFTADLFLFSFGAAFPRWPVELNRSGKKREQYIQAIRKADFGQFEPLIEYMIECGASAGSAKESFLSPT